MPASEPLRIFISYARKDGIELAQRLQKDLTKSGFDTWLDTQRIRGGAVWSAEIEREIDARQVTVALLSPGSYESEICRAEQLRALDKGNRVIPVLATKGADRPLYLYARQYRDFTKDSDHDVSLGELIADIRGDASATLPETYRKTRVTYLTSPPRVNNYLERPEVLRALRNTLFAEDHRQPIALTALAGMGGIGKTVLAKALTEDDVVRRAFPDGIVWITAGKERKRDFIAEMREVAKALGDDLSGYDNALACEHQYRTTIVSKAALIVVDDVWSKADIEPLLAESPCSRFLFTTRDASIGRFVGAREHWADLLDLAQSRELLASWANWSVAELPPVTDEIVHECGRLPLALSVVGAMLRRTHIQFWSDMLDLLRNADLSAIQRQLPPGQDSFFKAVEVSFQSLTPEMQERYTALAVLPDDTAVSLPVLQTLWYIDEREVRRLTRHFVDRSLAQPVVTDGSIRLHDLQLDYIRSRAGNDLQTLHSRLLDNYKRRFCLNGWHTGPNDGYFFQHLVYHFAQAGQSAEENGCGTVEGILTNRNFIKIKLSHNMVFGLVADLKIVARRQQVLRKATAALVTEFPRRKSEGFWQKLRAALNRYFGPYHKWPTALKRSLATSDNFNALLFAAQTLSMEGEYDEAAKLYTAMLGLSLSPEEYSAAIVRLSVTYEERKNTSRALRILNKLVALPSARKLYGDNFWWAQYQIGKNLLSAGRFDQARRVLENVRDHARDGSRRIAAIHQLGVIDLEEGRYEQAEQKFEQCLKARGDDPTNQRRAFEYRRLGEVYTLTGRNKEKVQNAFRTALEISRSCGDWRYVREMNDDEAQKSSVVKYLRGKKPKTLDLWKLSKRLGVTQLQLRQALATLAAEQRGYLELVDRWSGRPSGRVARWDVVHNAGRWHASVAVLVADSQGRIALQRRGESDSYGKWDISVAGHLDVGESDMQAAVRETREELQLDIESKMLMRLGKPYQFWKVGDGRIARDRHESASGYVYWKKNRNRERISLFLVKVSEKMKKQIGSFGENGALSIQWKTPREANKLATEEREECASSLKQFFTSTETLRYIDKVLQATH